MTFAPRLDILPAPQRALWPELAHVPAQFILYGGTALALRLGHRVSVDFDFFAHDPLVHRELETLSFMRGATTLQEGPDTKTVLVERSGEPVKLSFFGSIAFGRVGVPERTNDGVVSAASLLDLAGTKLKALLQRVEAKDYRDIAALLGAGIALADILAAAGALFGSAFNPIVARKALSYFEGGDLASLEPELRSLLIEAATQDVPSVELLLRSPRLDERG